MVCEGQFDPWFITMRKDLGKPVVTAPERKKETKLGIPAFLRLKAGSYKLRISKTPAIGHRKVKCVALNVVAPEIHETGHLMQPGF